MKWRIFVLLKYTEIFFSNLGLSQEILQIFPIPIFLFILDEYLHSGSYSERCVTSMWRLWAMRPSPGSLDLCLTTWLVPVSSGPSALCLLLTKQKLFPFLDLFCWLYCQNFFSSIFGNSNSILCHFYFDKIKCQLFLDQLEEARARTEICLQEVSILHFFKKAFNAVLFILEFNICFRILLF